MKKFFRATYDFITDQNGDGDVAKLGGFVLMAVSIVRFGVTGDFDGIAFGAGAAAAVASKAIDTKLPKTE